MKNSKIISDDAKLFRQKAEQLVKKKNSSQKTNLNTVGEPIKIDADTQTQLYEFEVRQIALELQNQELQLALDKAETNAEKYTTLYNLTPTAYITLKHNGEICELNLSAANLLNSEHSQLMQCNFNLLIAPTFRITFDNFLNRLLETKIPQNCQVKLLLDENLAVFVQIDGIFVEMKKEYVLSVINISEPEHAERRRNDMDTKWKTLFKDTPNLAVKGYDKNGITTYWNKAAENFYGYSAAEAIGAKLTDLIVPVEAKSAVNAEIKEMLRTKTALASSELQLKRKDGSSLDVFSSHAYVHPLGGEPEMYCLDIDLSEQKLVEEKYHILIQDSPVGIYQTDAQGKCIFTNRNWRKMSGLTEEEAKGDGWIKALHEDDTNKVFQNWKRMVESNGKWGHEYRIKDRAGKVSWVFGTASTMYNEANEVMGYIGTNTDITKLKQTEKALKDSDARWRTFLQDIPKVAVQGYDINGKTVYWNKASELLYGYPAEEAIGIPLIELVFPEESKSNFVKAFKQMFATKTPIPASELNLKHKDGSPINVYSSHAYVEIPGCEPEMYCIDIDLSERKKAEADSIKAKEKAEESDRLKSAFLANMSHEIRTPMNGILGFADLLKKPNLSGEQQQDYINIIKNSGTRMLNIINSIVSISKIESGSKKVNNTELDINEQINYIYTFFKPEVEAKGIQFSFKNAAPSSTNFICSDREKLLAILTNLVKNAIKFTERGSIALGYIQKDTFVEFYVEDTGIGIACERQEAIFERFIQADITDKLAFQGAGLGLAISKAYVEMLGGKLWVESKTGKGSIFRFTIPQKIDLKKSAKMTKDSKNTSADFKINNLKILIAEDDEASQFLLSLMLKEISAELLHASNGMEVVELCRKNPDLDLILMDIKMPIISGYEATRQIREFNTDVIVIAQTAFGLSGDREKVMEAGCNDYLSKPVTKDNLISTIKKHFVHQS
jgi:PAS domain S-box-containing protein